MKIGFVFSSFVLCSFSNCFAETVESPNIIFILADDMGFGDISYINAESKIKTSNLDIMANEGAVFMDCHSSSSVSTPTRYGILTGRYNWRSSLKQGVLNGYSKALIPSGRETIASMLKKHGYNTAAIGKWHLGWDWANIDNGKENINYEEPIKNGPTTLGFDYFYGFCASLDMPPYVYVENDMPTAVPDTITENKGKYSWWRKGPTSPDFVHEDVLSHIVELGCKYILEKSQQPVPYFLYLPLPAPHTPILPTDEFHGKSGIGEYGDYVLRVDAMIGKILDTVKESGKDDNTIIVFTADNGCSPAAGISEMEKLGHKPNYIYRGHKADLFDGGNRIPCIFRWPAKVPSHKIYQTVCLTDFYATFASLNGYKLQDTEGEDSYDILPALYSNEEISPIREAIVHHSVNGEFSIRQGRWKLLLSASSGGWSYPRPGKNDDIIKALPPVQLYDMESDPYEQKNLAKEYPDKVEELKLLLLRYIENGRSTPGLPQKNDKSKIWKQLEKIKGL